MRVSRNRAIPEIVLTIPQIINRTEESPVGASPPFDSIGINVGDGPPAGGEVGIIMIGVGVGVAEAVAANTVNDCIKVLNIPAESRVFIVIV